MHNDRQILLYENEENALGIINYKDRDLSKLHDVKGQYLDPIIGEFNENIYLISSHRSESGLVLIFNCLTIILYSRKSCKLHRE